jgi:hypothetical protein
MKRTLLTVMASLAFAVAALGLGATEASAQTPRTITMGTAGPGSVVYVWVTSLSQALSTINAPVRIQVNAGVFDVEGMRVMEAGGAGLDSSFVSGSSLVSATLGRPPFEGKPMKNLRGAFPLGQAPVVVVSREGAGINGLKDLDGKRVTAGPAGTGNDIMMRGLIAKVTPTSKPSYSNMTYASFAPALQDGKVDAVFILGWPPYPAVVETAALIKIKYVPFSENEMKTWLADNPQHHRMVLKAGMNPQQSVDIKTFGHVSHLIVPAKLDEEVVYQLTKAWMRPDVHKQLLNASSTWEAAFMAFDTGLYFQDLEALKAKLHPGAVRAYKEAGIKVPAAILP